MRSRFGYNALSGICSNPEPQKALVLGIENLAIIRLRKSSSVLESKSVVTSAVPARKPSWKYGRRAEGGQMLNKRTFTMSCSELMEIRFVRYGIPTTKT